MHKQALCAAEHTEFLKHDGMPPEESEELIIAEMGPHVAAVSDQIFAMFEDLCFGNPFVIMNLAEHIKASIIIS